MQLSDLKPVNTLVQRFGVKSLVYGGPGSGKTPIVNTAPNPVMMVVEPGILSMKKDTIPAWEAYTPQKIDEFFKWVFNSKETSKFDTLAIDSVSQLAEIILIEELAQNKDGRMAYGKMSKRMMDYMTALYFMPNKHVYLIAKMVTIDEMGISRKRPYFPGIDLNVKIPHMFDEILYAGKFPIPGSGIHPAFRTREAFDSMARDRSGALDEYEPTNLIHIFNKIMKAA